MQWEVSTNGGTTFSAITGATSTTYSFTATAAENGNQYEAVFSNSAGTRHQQPRHADGGLRPDRDREPGQPDGHCGRHGDLHGGGQRQSGAHACSGK